MHMLILIVMALGLLACGDDVDRSRPADASGAWTFVAVTDGTTCGIEAGTVRCWGLYAGAIEQTETASGMTGIAIHRDQGIPFGSSPDDYRMAGGHRGICMAGRDGFTCTHIGGSVYNRRIPVEVTSGDGGCVLDSEGKVECWTLDENEEEYIVDRPDGEFQSVAMGEGYGCGVLVNGALDCWGAAPEPLPSGHFKSIVASSDHLCGLRADDTVTCWGANTNGKATPPAGRFKQLAAGEGHTCGLTAGGAIRCWGSNVHGESSGR